MTSIVEQLAKWANENVSTLRDQGVEVTERFPQPGSNLAWKASVALAYGEILVSYTVWERSGLQTELIVMNARTKKTIRMDDKIPGDPRIVHSDLDIVVKKLFDGSYKRIAPDPKLIIR
jgi:hypothetical protein